jgi:lipid-binding SYLF domain-containing protein
MRTVKTAVVFATALLVAGTARGASKGASKNEAKELNEATTVLIEIRNADNGISEDIWSKAQCAVVIPSLKKAAFIVGVEGGTGVMSCRHADNTWSAPIFMRLEKGSAGFQIGAQSTDLVLLVMNKSGAEKLLNNKVTLGGDASVAAGPVGRTAGAATDAQMSAEMLSYSRSKGLFAGVNLSGGSLRPDDSANAKVYGSKAAKDIVLGTTPVTMTAEARAFTDALGRDVRATTGVKK